MIYIDLASNEKFPFLKNYKDSKLNNKKMYILKNDKVKTLRNIIRKLNTECESTVCLSEPLYTNNYFCSLLKESGVKIIDGKWLYKYLTINILNYICVRKKENLINQEITILANDINNFIYELLFQLSEKVRRINIYSNDQLKVKRIEKELYSEKGLLVNTVKNYKNGLDKSSIILNFDLDEEELNKYEINKKSCIINYKNSIKIKNKKFCGICSNFYDIELPKKYINIDVNTNNFNKALLYESYIIKNTMPRNIFNEIENDNVSLTFLKGNNGIINKKEYLNLIKYSK